MSSQTKPALSPIPAYLTLFLAAGWLLAGAVMKLWVASPNDIPPVVLKYAREWFDLGMVETYRWSITIELAVVSLVLVRPRLGWFVLAVQYVVFLAVLANLMIGGAHSCGCFGGVITVKPWEMALIDAPLLGLLLLSRPWKRLPKRPVRGTHLALLLALWAGAYFAPRLLFDAESGARGPRDSGGQEAPAPGTGDPSTPEAGPGAGGEDDPDADPGGAPDPGADPNAAGDPAGGTPDPAGDLPDFVELRVDTWDGSMIDQVDWASWLASTDPFEFPDTCHVVVYRKTCEVCRDHLRELATTSPITDRPVVLLRIPDVNDAQATSVIEVKPEAFLDVDLLELKKGYGITTPLSFDLEGFVITNVVDVREQRGH